MAAKLAKFSSVAGVIAPGYRNRTDLNKYDLALEEGQNWFVDYQGGLASRQGFEFHDYIMEDDKNVKIAAFQYGLDVANTYLVVFGHRYIRFVQDGAYVVEASKNITAVSGLTITSAAHGFEDDDWCKLTNSPVARYEGATVIIANKTTNTFELVTPFGDQINLDGGDDTATISRIYTLESEFGTNKIPFLKFHQIRDTLRVTSSERDFLPYSLTRTDSTNWSLTRIDFENGVAVPENLAYTCIPGDWTIIYVVTAVGEDDEESLPSQRIFVENAKNFQLDQGFVQVTWDAIPGVKYYNVYRSILSRDNKLSAAAQVGFVGRAYGPIFTDNNIVPDNTKTPPTSRNPFANSAIEFIEVTAPGSGYTFQSTVTVTDAEGSGFDGFPVVNDAGELLAIVVTNRGQDYVSPTVSVSDGTGATFTVTLTDEDGNFPAVGAIFQQRQIYASTFHRPLSIEGSKPGLYNNFDASDIVVENDAYSYDIDAEIIAPIKHLVPTRAGLLICSAAGMWQLAGTNDGPVTATDANVSRQSYTGVADVAPLRVNEDLLVLDAENSSVRLLAYSDFQKGYVSTDVSILSNHYFDKDNLIESWSYLTAPHKLVISQREDGSAVIGCVVKEHEIFGWTDWCTQGYLRQVELVKEGTRDRLYAIVERLVNGQRKKYIESLTQRKVTNVEDYVGLDSALSLAARYPSAAVTPSGLTGTIVLEADSNVFVNADIGRVFRGGGGVGEVTARTSPTQVTVVLSKDITKTVPCTTEPAELASGDWTLDEPVDYVEGLDHLEGKTVSALLDGSVYHDYEVTNGRVDFPVQFTRATVGLKYCCLAKALPPSVPNAIIEPDRKRVVGIAAYHNETRGLRYGTTREAMYEAQPLNPSSVGLPPALSSGFHFVSVEPVWEVEAGFYIEQPDPLPASVLGWVTEIDKGEDDD